MTAGARPGPAAGPQAAGPLQPDTTQGMAHIVLGIGTSHTPMLNLTA